MAKQTLEIAGVLRKTAAALVASDHYQWGHMGLCNCGFLAQQVTKLSKTDIHTRAMQQHGDWSEQLRDYCPSSGLPMDELIDRMVAAGFSTDDLAHLERLSHPAVLANLPPNSRVLRHNVQADVVRYLHAWADLIERELVSDIRLPMYMTNAETIL